jgi:hypothetical protein
VLSPGEKAQPWCEPDRCPAYKFVLAFSNNSEVDGVLRCPKYFCDRALARYKCVDCGRDDRTVMDGRDLAPGKFKCWVCQEPGEPGQPSQPSQPSTESDQGLLQKIEEYMIEKTGNNKFLALYSDINSEGNYRFYNPFNDFAEALVIPEKSNFNDAVIKLDSFFATMLTRKSLQMRR